MMGDIVIMIVAALVLLYGFYRWLYRWLHHRPYVDYKLEEFEATEISPQAPHVQLLVEAGYRVECYKYRIPLSFQVDGEQFQSRLFIDMMAYKDGKSYIVKLANQRMPMEWTGSAIRDRLLIYSLLFPEVQGVLYVDRRVPSVRVVLFSINGVTE